MECQLQQPYILNSFRLNRLNAGDVEEVIFVVVDEISLHLRWRHPAVWLRHVDYRQVQVRKNIDGHPDKREYRAEGHSDDHNDHRDRVAKRPAEEPHGYRAPCAVFCNDCRNGARSPCAAATEARPCQTARRASASSISAWTRKLCASETSTSVANPA